jgi:hypothetical protein
MTDTVAQAQAAETSDTHQVAINVDSSVATTGLPVAGYKKTQPAHLIALVNENKLLEEKILRQIERHKERGSELDQRAVALAFTAIQDAFMWLNRGVFQPQRLTGDLD